MGRFRSRLKASLQSATALGIAMIVLTWGTIVFQLHVNQRTAVQGAFQESANLARSFEEQIIRTIRGIDSTLLVLRAIYVKDSEKFDLPEWTWHAGIVTDVVLQYSIIDPNGQLRASSLGTVASMNLSDRDHFKVHVESNTDEVFISKLLTGRNSGKTSIQLSRRILLPDGTFAGVIVASVDPAQLGRFYQSINIGRDGAINVIGLDGFVRASRGFKKEVVNFGGGPILTRVNTEPVGSFIDGGTVDGVRRILSFRKVAGLPLVVAVGLGDDEVMASFFEDALKYIAAGVAITILVVLVMGASIRHRKTLSKTYLALRRSEIVAQARKTELRSALENIEQGIFMVDAEGMVNVINQRAVELLDLPKEWLAGSRPLKEMIAFLRDRGEFADNEFTPRVHTMLMGDGFDSECGVYERTRPNGVVLEVRSMATPDGGMVRTFMDITERKRAEARISEMATHDELTGLANRSLFRERVEQALNRAHRHGEPFALLMLDLDRFKPINDTLGHPVGDEVLKETALRLQFCVRETDTVARLGGDEFAILQAQATTPEEVAILAQRILGAIAAPLYINGHRIEIGTTIGVAFAPRDAADHEQLIAKADQALYEGKKNGRNCFSFASSAASLLTLAEKAAPSIAAAAGRR
ncbi:MAG TPA: diguanylate cyclase [Pseudorhodoplanes sp.]|nr:diguanylate cyclase [Pseudorhodoplanes sp.]